MPDEFEHILDRRFGDFEKVIDARLTGIQDGVNGMKDSIAIFVDKVSNMHRDFVPRSEIEREQARCSAEIDNLTKKVERLEGWRNYLTGAIALLVGGFSVTIEHFWK